MCVYKIHPVVCGGMYSKSIVLLYKMLYIYMCVIKDLPLYLGREGRGKERAGGGEGGEGGRGGERGDS